MAAVRRPGRSVRRRLCSLRGPSRGPRCRRVTVGFRVLVTRHTTHVVPISRCHSTFEHIPESREISTERDFPMSSSTFEQIPRGAPERSPQSARSLLIPRDTYYHVSFIVLWIFATRRPWSGSASRVKTSGERARGGPATATAMRPGEARCHVSCGAIQGRHAPDVLAICLRADFATT